MAQEVKTKYDALMDSFGKEFPKVDKKLLFALLERTSQKPGRCPMFTLEVFTKEGTDSVAATRMIIAKTGKVPNVYDKGTHYVTDQQLTLEILKEISADDDVIYVTGEPLDVGASRGPSHDHHVE